jgi:hypothetical protein
MALSTKTKKIIEIALADRKAGAELSAAVDNASAPQSSHKIAAMIVATAVSQTTDFGALQVGDLVVMTPATAGNADFIGPVAVAGTLGQAAVIGNLYTVYRAN